LWPGARPRFLRCDLFQALAGRADAEQRQRRGADTSEVDDDGVAEAPGDRHSLLDEQRGIHVKDPQYENVIAIHRIDSMIVVRRIDGFAGSSML
jgi:hypothetical protein